MKMRQRKHRRFTRWYGWGIWYRGYGGNLPLLIKEKSDPLEPGFYFPASARERAVNPQTDLDTFSFNLEACLASVKGLTNV